LWHVSKNIRWVLNLKNVRALFICSAKSNFIAGLQIFPHAVCDFLHPEELAPHAKTDECVPEVYKFG
jgi:hypothetical protein